MNSKKVNWLFTSIIILNVLVIILAALYPEGISIGMLPALLVSQAMIFVPAALFLVFTKTKPSDLIQMAKPKWSLSLLVVLITFMIMPLITAVNALSMLFVENEVTNMQALFLEVPWWLLILVVGFVGPFSEEAVFRGVIYHGYRRSGRFVAAMLMSSVLFGLMHLNFNQMSYAIVVGIVGVLLIEGTGSIFYSILFHATINTSNVLMMLSQDPATSSMDAAQTQEMVESLMKMPYREAMCVVCAVYILIACVTTSIAGCLYYLILKKEGRTEHVRLLFAKEGKSAVREQNQKIWSWPLVISMVLCLIYMIAEIALIK
nr:CPBP family intramembrane metalloprotease [Lachnospiraceae bacterium]